MPKGHGHLPDAVHHVVPHLDGSNILDPSLARPKRQRTASRYLELQLLMNPHVAQACAGEVLEEDGAAIEPISKERPAPMERAPCPLAMTTTLDHWKPAIKNQQKTN